MEVADPLVAHATAAWLSPAIQIVRSRTSRVRARTSLCAITPASSKSEIDMVPFGLSGVISAAAMWSGNRCRHRIVGGSLGAKASNQTPPMSTWHASQAPQFRQSHRSFVYGMEEK